MPSTGGVPSTGHATAAERVVRLADVVPAPAFVHPAGTGYTLTPDAVIRTEPAAAKVGEYLAEILRPSTGYRLPVVPAQPDAPIGGITLLLTGADPRVGREGYQLDSHADGVVIRAETPTGLFYGVQTLRQLLPPAVEHTTAQPGPWTVPGGRIVDHPRFAYRGAMLDVARHFFPVADVKRYLDELALYKINHLHLHLTDDQGWRIVIDAWPRLAAVGGATEVDSGPGGYYTKDEYRDIVAYAAARLITVVPEIDVPGHTNAALAAYPELTRNGVAPAPYTGTDVGFSALAVDKELTYKFIADVVHEIAALTPGPYLHIGGDEAWTLRPDEYTSFMNRVQAVVAGAGKTVMGWHQLAAADPVPGRVLQFWGTSRVEPAVAEAVRQGAKVVLSPSNRTYLDMKYAPDTPLGKDWAGPVEVRDAYDWDPGSYLVDVPADAVLGVEAPLWTETIATLDQIEFMAFPRLPAIAELAWSPAASHDWDRFRRRLAKQAPRWIAAGITFHPSAQVPWVMDATRTADDPVAEPLAETVGLGTRPPAMPSPRSAPAVADPARPE